MQIANLQKARDRIFGQLTEAKSKIAGLEKKQACEDRIYIRKEAAFTGLRAPISRPSSAGTRLKPKKETETGTPSSGPSAAPSAATSKVTIDEDLYMTAKRELVLVQKENYQLKKLKKKLPQLTKANIPAALIRISKLDF